MECIMICRWSATEYSQPFVAWMDGDDEAMTYTMSNWMRTGRTVEILDVMWTDDPRDQDFRDRVNIACGEWGNVFDNPNWGVKLRSD